MGARVTLVVEPDSLYGGSVYRMFDQHGTIANGRLLGGAKATRGWFRLAKRHLSALVQDLGLGLDWDASNVEPNGWTPDVMEAPEGVTITWD